MLQTSKEYFYGKVRVCFGKYVYTYYTKELEAAIRRLYSPMATINHVLTDKGYMVNSFNVGLEKVYLNKANILKISKEVNRMYKEGPYIQDSLF